MMPEAKQNHSAKIRKFAKLAERIVRLECERLTAERALQEVWEKMSEAEREEMQPFGGPDARNEYIDDFCGDIRS